MTQTRALAAASVLVAGGALLAATGAERVLGLVPCALCLLERWPYRVALVFAAIALLPLRRPSLRPVLWGVVLCMAVSLAAAAIHVGVEHSWWPSPLPECAAPTLGSGSLAERLAHMPAHPAKPCDDPTYLIPGLPVSLAAMNGLLALVFGGFLAMLLARNPPARSPR